MAVERLDNVEVDLTFLEIVMGGEEGGTVEFTVKELLTEIRKEIGVVRDEGRDRPTKEDFLRLQAQVDRIDSKVQTGELRWAKLLGALGTGAVLGGSVGAAVAKALGFG